ncbi:sigma-70 family RNA polymerase sigma factor [Listeria weihenstephanensis]|uniref:Sigma-70 family RNA polymerase sigma factor n=1 Tax=Listeria weihenstephanensis TaxID=1006155 RepID=A0A841Z8J8_9LIST|nr:sigma-70 family RNA polymerase sigma factor [Listeria weihenstephanensis]MBC1501245.1 sigma-70 family RNA polymerase sigma factor [Listeria weihenstephanensis]MBC1501518.1 sigma-70 family RNA polymerase sigma factor [Listeria weihenstephanensis]
MLNKKVQTWDEHWRKHKQHTFDTFCKKIIKNELFNFYTEINRRKLNEVSIDQMQFLNYISDPRLIYDAPKEFVFMVNETEIVVKDEQLGEALNLLSEDKRNIVLLAYFLNLSDVEIATKLGTSTRRLNRIRHKILVELKDIIKDGGSLGERKTHKTRTTRIRDY